ncbi:MAG: DUF5723 family protein [Bacteroidales bacterium]|jgi:hypothetical protein|nr:DUF5723 family protein [Bacteroidales bacterium]
MRVYLTLIFNVTLLITALGQYGSYGVTDARSLGMGNTYNATSFDLYAIGKNPGLLAKNDANCKVTFIFPNLTAQQYGIGRALSTFDYYTTNRLQSDGLITINEEKFKVAMENNGKLFVDGLVGFFSAAYHHSERIGSFAFSMSDYLSAFLDVPDVALDINYGGEVPDGSIEFNDFNFKSQWIRTYALSYSRYIYRDKSLHRNDPGFFKSISAGLTAKYVLTYAYTDIALDARMDYSSATQTLTGNYSAQAIHSFSPDIGKANAFIQDDREPRGFLAMRPAGKGYSFDVGGAAELKNGWVIGVAVTDLGRINWKGSAKKSKFEGYIDISGAIDNETIDSIAAGISLDNETQESFTTPMPTAVRLGVALNVEDMFKRFPGELLVGVDYNQGLNNQPSNSKRSRFSVGFQYRFRPKWPILIGGYTYSLIDSGRGAVGLGYSNWLFDVYISTIDLADIVSGGDRFSASLVARWKLFCGHARNKAPECF